MNSVSQAIHVHVHVHSHNGRFVDQSAGKNTVLQTFSLYTECVYRREQSRESKEGEGGEGEGGEDREAREGSPLSE